MKQENDIFPDFNDFSVLFENVLRSNGLDRFADIGCFHKFYDFALFLRKENQKYNLTALISPEGISLLHFTDSLLLASSLRNAGLPLSGTLLDIGSGAGFPAVPLAIIFPGMKITALDATKKKTEFISAAARMLDLASLSAVNARAEEFCGKEGRSTFDIVTARGVADLAVLSEFAAPALKNNGVFVAMKGDRADEEMNGYRSAEKKLGIRFLRNESLQLIGTEQTYSRSLLWFQKIKPTDTAYPRPYAKIKSKPLF